MFLLMKNYNKINNFYVEEKEQALIKHIIPQYYVDHNDVEVDYALRFLQNELNGLLGSFVNGGFSYKGYMLHPLVSDVSKENIENIKKLRKIIVFLGKNGYNFSKSIKTYRNNINSKNFAIILSSLYQDLYSIKFKKIKRVIKNKCLKFNVSNFNKFDYEYLKPVIELSNYANKKLKQFLSGFYLHGSIATNDFIKGFSDLDTVSIVSKETINNPDLLLELRNRMYYARSFFYRIDPLQHHGSIILSKYELENYCQSYFPIEIFKYAKSFFEDRIKDFRVRNSSSESLVKMFWFVCYFRRLHTERKYNLNSYDTKMLLHSITLFPSLYLQTKGRFVYKKFSFNLAKRDFSKEIWKVIDDVSVIRKKWKNITVLPSIKMISRFNPLFFYQINFRAADIFNGIKKLNNIDTKQLIEGMHKLSEEAWNNVKHNVKI